MKYLRYALIAVSLLVPSMAQAVGCFWVGGSGIWSTTNTASWASVTNGTGGTCAATGGVPKQTTDIATFDGAAGGLNGGTVTVDFSMNGGTINVLNAGAMNGTLDFSVNNPSMSFSAGSGADGINFSGSGTRTFKMGSGTFTLSNGGTYDLTTTGGLATSIFSSATFVLSATALVGQQAFNGGGQTYGTLTVNGRTSITGQGFVISGVNTFGTMNLVGPLITNFQAAQTITNLNVSGNSSNYVFFPALATQTTTQTLTVTSASVDRAVLRGVIFAGAAVNATNSIDLGNNNMNGGSITPPASGGGGSRCIGC